MTGKGITAQEVAGEDEPDDRALAEQVADLKEQMADLRRHLGPEAPSTAGPALRA